MMAVKRRLLTDARAVRLTLRLWQILNRGNSTTALCCRYRCLHSGLPFGRQ